jgi:hypothetical protein
MTAERRSLNVSRSVAFACALSAFLAAHQHALAQSSRSPSVKSHPHTAVAKRTVEFDIPEFSVTETSLAAGTKTQNAVRDRRRRYDAFTVADTQLFVTERRTGKTREIRGLPFEWRPFSDVMWEDSRTLVFDRWSSPHAGVHYAVDVVTRRLIAAVEFHDP